MMRENTLLYKMDEKREKAIVMDVERELMGKEKEQAFIYSGWGESTSYIVMDDEREKTIIIIKINGWGERTSYYNVWGERTS